MRKLVAVLLMLAGTCCAQSLGDVAKANRDKPKPKGAKKITNEDLPGEKRVDANSTLALELEHVRQVLRGICEDPKTNNGRVLSDYDKQSLDEGVKPLRARVNEYERIQKDYKERLKKLEENMEAESRAEWPKGRPFNEADIQKFKSMQIDYEARRVAIVKEGEERLSGFRPLQLQLEEVGKECPEAAKSVPD